MIMQAMSRHVSVEEDTVVALGSVACMLLTHLRLTCRPWYKLEQ